MTDLSTLVGFGSGGGSGAGAGDVLHGPTPTATATIDRTNLDTRKPYEYTSGMFPGASPNGNIKSRNVFATWAQWHDQSNGDSGFHISSFSVNRSTGAISILQSGPQLVWLNTTVSAMSTTYLVHDAVHGCFFSAGNNGYPGYSSHVFGYTAGQVDTNGAVAGGTSAYTGADHAYNGTYCGALNQGTGTQYFMTGGYQSYAGHRVHQATASGLTIGSWVHDASWTSSSQAYDHMFQPDQTVSSGEAESIHGTSFSNPDYGFNVMRGGVVSQLTTENGHSFAQVFTGAGGTTFINHHNSFYGTVGNGSNSKVSLADGTRDMGLHTITSNPDASYSSMTVGIGANKFLFFRPGHAKLPKDACELIGIETNQNPKRLATLTFGGGTDSSILDGDAADAFYFPVWENDNDTYPKWLVRAPLSDKRNVDIRVYEITADFSQYTI